MCGECVYCVCTQTARARASYKLGAYTQIAPKSTRQSSLPSWGGRRRTNEHTYTHTARAKRCAKRHTHTQLSVGNLLRIYFHCVPFLRLASRRTSLLGYCVKIRAAFLRAPGALNNSRSGGRGATQKFRTAHTKIAHRQKRTGPPPIGMLIIHKIENWIETLYGSVARVRAYFHACHTPRFEWVGALSSETSAHHGRIGEAAQI